MRRLMLGLAVAILPGCSPRSNPPAGRAQALTAGNAETGRKIYEINCIACHHSDPALAGAIGPEVKGSDFALLEARLLRAEYPPGYTPKRETRAMAALPALKRHLGDLAAYLK